MTGTTKALTRARAAVNEAGVSPEVGARIHAALDEVQRAMTVAGEEERAEMRRLRADHEAIVSTLEEIYADDKRAASTLVRVQEDAADARRFRAQQGAPPQGQPSGNPGALAVPVTGVWLRRIGNEAQVLVETGGPWRLCIREPFDGMYSHIVEPAGMRAAPVDGVTGGATPPSVMGADARLDAIETKAKGELGRAPGLNLLPEDVIARCAELRASRQASPLPLPDPAPVPAPEPVRERDSWRALASDAIDALQAMLNRNSRAWAEGRLETFYRRGERLAAEGARAPDLGAVRGLVEAVRARCHGLESGIRLVTAEGRRIDLLSLSNKLHEAAGWCVEALASLGGEVSDG